MVCVFTSIMVVFFLLTSTFCLLNVNDNGYVYEETRTQATSLILPLFIVAAGLLGDFHYFVFVGCNFLGYAVIQVLIDLLLLSINLYLLFHRIIVMK